MNTQLYVFTNGAYDKNRLQDIYLINQDNVPAVGSLESIDKMKELLSISSYHSVLLLNKNVIGFSICFREGTSYWSENYKYFTQGLKNFLYIDRIAIDQNYRREGLGKSMYKDIFSSASHENLRVTAEVNTKPKNQISLDFHNNMGFEQIGERQFDDHDVVYLIK
ncbi:GNAT family N-acetyltransferase [Gammaproteobacteria bacterium]|jgi:predicted GNAT superfamily acetyltransferase|nr:GNAT family N-acetyltransferase [Gammaproteobacteria bacterium]|tara:strand:+ start:106 stop:600 length:495 start_codon:yes stop_codon:yes gene_type:complete